MGLRQGQGTRRPAHRAPIDGTGRAVRRRGASATATTKNGRSKKKGAERFLDAQGRLRNGWWLLAFSLGFIGGGCLIWAAFLLWLQSGM